MRRAVGGRGDGEETGGCVDAIQHGDTFEAAEGVFRRDWHVSRQ